MSRIAIGSDHAGYELKRHLVELLAAGGHEVTDVGNHSLEAVDYPIYCAEVGRQVRDGHADLGIVVGGSGQGEQLPRRGGLCRAGHGTKLRHRRPLRQRGRLLACAAPDSARTAHGSSLALIPGAGAGGAARPLPQAPTG